MDESPKIGMSLLQFFSLIAVAVGAAKMGHLESRKMGLVGATLACVPGLSPFLLLGIPFGVWSLCF